MLPATAKASIDCWWKLSTATPCRFESASVSYTHLDVYKRQTQAAERREFTPQMQSMLLAVAGAARNTRIALDDSSNDKPGDRRD